MRVTTTIAALALSFLTGAQATIFCYASNELCEAQTNCRPCDYLTSEDVAAYPYCCTID